MATNTPNFNLLKPDLTDNVDIDDLNGNMDIIDTELQTIIDSIPAIPTNITNPTAGQKLVFDGTNWVNLTGYVYVSTVYFTSSGTFTKADYPWLRAIRVKVQAAGGGGGGAVASGGNFARGGGGGGGAYTEKFITDIASLLSGETVTVGSAGTGGAATPTAGTAGGASSFGAILVCGGGNGGETTAGIFIFDNGGIVTTPGDFAVKGGEGGARFQSIAQARGTSAGGAAFLGGGANVEATEGGGITGSNAIMGFGGGGGGGLRGSATNSGGGNGRPGIVIVELYA